MGYYSADEMLQDDSYYRHLEELYEEEMSVEGLSAYLGCYGDALERRVRSCLSEAKLLLGTGFAGPALLVAVTGIEITLHYFVLKPLVKGAFLSDLWADLLLDRVIKSHSSLDRQLLPKILSRWGVDLDSLILPGGRRAWKLLTEEIWPQRNRFVHRSDYVAPRFAEEAIQVGELLFTDILQPIARCFYLSWPESGSWCQVVEGVGAGRSTKLYSAEDPLADLQSGKRKGA